MEFQHSLRLKVGSFAQHAMSKFRSASCLLLYKSLKKLYCRTGIVSSLCFNSVEDIPDACLSRNALYVFRSYISTRISRAQD